MDAALKFPNAWRGFYDLNFWGLSMDLEINIIAESCEVLYGKQSGDCRVSDKGENNQEIFREQL